MDCPLARTRGVTPPAAFDQRGEDLELGDRGGDPAGRRRAAGVDLVEVVYARITVATSGAWTAVVATSGAMTSSSVIATTTLVTAALTLSAPLAALPYTPASRGDWLAKHRIPHQRIPITDPRAVEPAVRQRRGCGGVRYEIAPSSEMKGTYLRHSENLYLSGVSFED